MPHRLTVMLAVTLVLGPFACAEEAAQQPAACVPQAPGQISLPADDAAHEAPIEWWYWTGHLEDQQGRRYGFQQTFFLFEAAGTTAQVSNSGLTDVEGARFYRDGGFTFGARPETVGGVELVIDTTTATVAHGHDTFAAVFEDGASYDLEATTDRPAVRHHGTGYIDYGFGGNTYYYSRPRMDVSGTVTIAGEARAVQGTAWFDHQWGELGPLSDIGWDWFALQLDDGRDIMVFKLRADEGGGLLGGTISDAAGCTEEVHADDVVVTPHDTWTSQESGCVYPMGWTVAVGDELFEITPLLLAQEQVDSRDGSRTYWEGAADVSGSVLGRAYVELAGYCSTE